ncbi:DUF3592 domain-containing protein [Paenimyroides aestuarii]|uniref:DUF3592 domain-containing protein n=1 Tax=Paenimyroides aestuarii TaxID=2968490 RepID=A0ABY5NQR2_9FLAO|nr:DUF3592 domain-containing protein [Paenimyroides aestuarii]UUV20868.1 DUF3592 domain-containing protein [Paenimyroides aestuarii]
MQSKGAKIGFIVLVLLVFGGAVFFMYGPNSHNAKQKAETKERLKNYVRAEAEIITTESNGRIGKGADVIYTVQFMVENTQSLKTANFGGREDGWSDNNYKKGDKVVLYYDPENPNLIESEIKYKEVLNY